MQSVRRLRHSAPDERNAHNRATENDMQITKKSIEPAAGPREWFTGTVYIDTVATPSAPSRLSASSVHVTPEAPPPFHLHPPAPPLSSPPAPAPSHHRDPPTPPSPH